MAGNRFDRLNTAIGDVASRVRPIEEMMASDVIGQLAGRVAAVELDTGAVDAALGKMARTVGPVAPAPPTIAERLDALERGDQHGKVTSGADGTARIVFSPAFTDVPDLQLTAMSNGVPGGGAQIVSLSASEAVVRAERSGRLGTLTLSNIAAALSNIVFVQSGTGAANVVIRWRAKGAPVSG